MKNNIISEFDDLLSHFIENENPWSVMVNKKNAIKFKKLLGGVIYEDGMLKKDPKKKFKQSIVNEYIIYSVKELQNEQKRLLALLE